MVRLSKLWPYSESDLLPRDEETNSYFITIFVSEQIYNLIIRFNIDLC